MSTVWIALSLASASAASMGQAPTRIAMVSPPSKPKTIRDLQLISGPRLAKLLSGAKVLSTATTRVPFLIFHRNGTVTRLSTEPAPLQFVTSFRMTKTGVCLSGAIRDCRTFYQGSGSSYYMYLDGNPVTAFEEVFIKRGSLGARRRPHRDLTMPEQPHTPE